MQLSSLLQTMQRQHLLYSCVLACALYACSQAVNAEPSQEQIENAISTIERLSESRNGITSLKKIVTSLDNDLRSSRQLDNVARKRKGLEILQRILNEMEADLMYEQKRTCQFNLGGHCATETAAYVADHWHYLNSPLSPGRKRRDTRLYQKLMRGQLTQ